MTDETTQSPPPELIELEEDFIVVSIPSQAVSLTISATVWTEDGPIDVSKTMSFSEIRAAIEDARENYESPDVVWRLTDAGRAELERLRALNNTEEVKT